MHEKKQELVSLLAKECGNLEEVQAMLKSLFAGTIEQMLEAEMDEHLGYEKFNVVMGIVATVIVLLSLGVGLLIRRRRNRV